MQHGLIRSTAAAAGLTLALAAQGAGACEIEDWRYYERAGYLTIEGAATCRSGRITIRAYDGSGEFVGTDFTYIRGYSFTLNIRAQVPNSLEIRYSIDRD